MVIGRIDDDIEVLTRACYAGWLEGLAPTNADAPVMPAVVALRKAKDELMRALDYLSNCQGDSV
jgi:hypothetical protein